MSKRAHTIAAIASANFAVLFFIALKTLSPLSFVANWLVYVVVVSTVTIGALRLARRLGRRRG